MEIEILGAHMTEIEGAKPAALLIDGVLALDAGSLCSNLSLDAQRQIKAILITHYHYDHVRDIPAIAMNVAYYGTIEVFSIRSTFDVLSTHLLDGKMYPDFRAWPESRPALRLVPVDPYNIFDVGGYGITAVPVKHGVPAAGFQVSSASGKKVFYTGDTGTGLSECWDHVSPDLLITEVSLPDKLHERATKSGHLTPGLLKEELLEFRKLKGYLPDTVVVHITPWLEEEIAGEVDSLSRELDAGITLGREGLRISL